MSKNDYLCSIFGINGVGVTNFDDIYLFCKVAQVNSYTKAGEQLGIPKSTLSRRVKNLEERIGVKLVNRDTRSFTLTEAGLHLFKNSQRSFLEISNIERETSNYQTMPAGDLKVTVPVEISMAILNEIMAEFVKLHPQINLELNITNDLVDLIEGGYDLAIRGGSPKDSSLVSKKIMSSKFHLCCSPEYINKYGLLSDPQQFNSHKLMTLSLNAYHNIRFTKADKQATLHVKNTLRTNSMDMVLKCALKGLCISILPTSVCYSSIKKGELVTVMDDWSSPEIALYALFPNRIKTKKLELLLKHIEDNLAGLEETFLQL